MVGDKTKLSNENLTMLPWVDKLVPITESYKLSNRKFHPEPSRVKVKEHEIGPDTLTIMAGPCAVENEEQLMTIAREVKKSGAQFVRGGAYKPRTSPYSFQGLEEEGLRYMAEAGKEYDLCTICEVISEEAIEAAAKYVDMIQIGARNMQNFQLLREAGRSGMPVLLKRGLAATIDEWLNAGGVYHRGGESQGSALRAGNPHLVETSTRNTLDFKRGSGDPPEIPSACHCGSQPRYRGLRLRASSGQSRRGLRSGRADDRGSQRSGARSLRRALNP